MLQLEKHPYFESNVVKVQITFLRIIKKNQDVSILAYLSVKLLPGVAWLSLSLYAVQ